jgi:hypothetical protein
VQDRGLHGKPLSHLGPGEQKPSVLDRRWICHNRSTLDHLVNLDHQIQNSFLLGQHVVVIFFNLQKAYDTAWQYDILRTLHQWNLRGQLHVFISNFLQDDYFGVRFGSVLSARCHQENGVSQGIVLSVTLFAITINGAVNVFGPSVSASLFGDDLAIFYGFQVSLVV